MNEISRFNSKRLIDNRQIRIFLSSTFSDMQEERSALVKTFEMLKFRAAKRDVSLSVVDLRWGVTEEEARTGKVISVCLNEIEHSHPFFIGVLGNNYGTSPKRSELEKNPDLLERYPWLNSAISDNTDESMSITEMEIQYGVLTNTGDIDAAFFLKKSSLPDNHPRLTTLKKKICSQNQHPHCQYDSVNQLCYLVEDEVNKIIDKHFPEKEVSELERIRNAQRAYINSSHANYIERPSCYARIDDFVRSEAGRLIITGKSGIGKSALLANWIKMNENSKEFNLIYHFIGNSFSDNDCEHVLRHLCDEVYDLYDINKDIHLNESTEEEAKRLFVEVKSFNKPLIVVIDGINQIVEQTGIQKDAKLLLWLPAANKHVKFIFSTLREDDTMRVLGRHEYTELEVTSFTPDERKDFIQNYLSYVGKHLDDHQEERIANDPKNENTLVLKTLLDELICFGNYDSLDSKINYYLTASSTPNFFDRMLQRMEKDYSANQNLVRHALTLIAISEKGLSEDELISILGCRPIDWHLFAAAFNNHIVVKNNLLTFSHQYITFAVRNRYDITGITTISPYCREIVSYCSSKPSSNRYISELAYQYYRLSAWKELHDVLLDFKAFMYLYSYRQLLLSLYWKTLINVDKNHFSLRSYMSLRSDGQNEMLAEYYNSIALFVENFINDYSLALEYYHKALDLFKKNLGETDYYVARTLNNIAGVLETINCFSDAFNYYQQSLLIKKTLFGESHPEIALTYNNIGYTYNQYGNYNRALDYLHQALFIKEKTNISNQLSISTTLDNIGSAYFNLKKYDKALECFQKSLDIKIENLGDDHFETAMAYDNLGNAYQGVDMYSQALDYHLKALPIIELFLGDEHLDTAVVYDNVGSLLIHNQDYANALNYCSNALAIRKKTFGDNNLNVATSYNNVGYIYYLLSKYSKALENYTKSFEIFLNINPNHPNAVGLLNNIDLVFRKEGDLTKSLKFHLDILDKIKMTLGDDNPLAAKSYENIGKVYFEQKEFQKALSFFLKALGIFGRTQGVNHQNVASVYNNIGNVYMAMGNFSKALEYFSKAQEIQNTATR